MKFERAGNRGRQDAGSEIVVDGAEQPQLRRRAQQSLQQVGDRGLAVIALHRVEAERGVRVPEEAAGDAGQRAERIGHLDDGQTAAEGDAGPAGAHNRDGPAGNRLIQPGPRIPGGRHIEENAARHHLPGVRGQARNGAIQRTDRRDALIGREEVAQASAPGRSAGGGRRQPAGEAERRRDQEATHRAPPSCRATSNAGTAAAPARMSRMGIRRSPIRLKEGAATVRP